MTELLEIKVEVPELGSHQLRDCLGLSLISGHPFTIKGLLGANPEKPGIRREDVIAIDLATSVGKARVDGARTASTEVTFWPTGLHAGNYTFSVGSAGNAVHLIQVVALPLCFGTGTSEVTVFGVTHDPRCSSYEFFENSYIRVLRAGGLLADPTLHYAGYSPLGVGKVSLSVGGGQLLRRFHLLEKGRLTRKKAHIVIGERDAEVRTALKAKCAEILSLDLENLEMVPRPNGPDKTNSLTVHIESEFITEIFSNCCHDSDDFIACVKQVAGEVHTYLDSGAAAGPSLSEHLLMVMAAAGGGSFTTYHLTPRAEATMELIRRFLQVEVKQRENAAGNIEVEIKER